MSASVIDLEAQAYQDITYPRLLAGAVIAAAGLMGFGLILWIAANWDGIGRFVRFGLVGAALAAGALGAVVWPALRAPLLLAAFSAAGGMLALIGQTYQTGADPWQLFALWAALTLPWALAARSDVLWTPWCIVSVTALTLFQHSYGALEASFRAQTTPMSVLVPGSPAFMVVACWVSALALCAAL
jgi:uncharacterized membrane protein